jgi:hypothetical protein
VSGSARAQGVPVVVTAHGHHRRHLAQSLEDLRRPDVPCVNDELAAGERAHGLGPEQTVRVRDHAEKMLSHPGSRTMGDVPCLAREARMRAVCANTALSEKRGPITRPIMSRSSLFPRNVLYQWNLSDRFDG